MNRQMKYRSLFMFLVFAAVGALVISCAPKAAKPVGEMDTPEHHFYTGVKLLDQGKYAEAQTEFDRSIQLAPKFSKAYAGNGLVKAYQGDSKGAFEVMKQALKHAKQDDETVFVHVCKIRLYTMGKPDKDWLNDALSEFEAAIKIDPKSSAAYHLDRKSVV
jgi:tetratricopeptide (TPR) repeat protein